MPIDEFLFFGKISVYPILVEGVVAIKTEILPISGRQTWWWWEISSWGLGELARPAFYYMVWPLQQAYRLPSKNLWSECHKYLIYALKRFSSWDEIILDFHCMFELKVFFLCILQAFLYFQHFLRNLTYFF